MTNRRHSIQTESQLMNINQSLHTIDHYLAVGDHGRARLETECIITLMMELHIRLSSPENIGRQPEETLTLNNTTDYNICVLMNFV